MASSLHVTLRQSHKQSRPPQCMPIRTICLKSGVAKLCPSEGRLHAAEHNKSQRLRCDGIREGCWGVVQVRYCLHVQQRLLKVEWPIRLAEHPMARTISLEDMEGGGPGGQILFNGLRVRMAISTGQSAGIHLPSLLNHLNTP